MYKGEATATLPNGGTYTSTCGHQHRSERRARRCAGKEQTRIAKLLERHGATGGVTFEQVTQNS
jgi:hypothetical protein